MGVDHTDNGTDDGAENVEKPSAKEAPWRPPPDRPGSPGQPSRLESYKAAAATYEAATEQRDERDDKQPPPARETPGAATQEKPGQADTETTDRGTRSSETESDDRLRDDRSPAAAPGEDMGRQTEQDRPTTRTDEGEGEADAPTAEDRPDSERPESVSEADTEDEAGEAPATDTQPEPEGKPEKPSGRDVWEEFASKPATYELDGRQFGFRTWGEEFAARRASREARQAREAESAERQDESSAPEQASAEEPKNATEAGTGQPDGENIGSGETADAGTKADEKDDPGTGVADSDTEAAEPETAGQNDAWREHADAMRAKWADLESEQTPDEPPEKNDQGDGLQGEGTSEGTGDEPGSWRGDGDQYLNLEENYAVDRAFGRLCDQEGDVTDSLKTREAEMADAKLVGLEYRLKGEDRFKEKVAEKLAAELRKSPTEAAESVSDGLRYTYQIPADSYVQGYQQIANGLKKDGFEMVFCRNSWDGAEYKGVNTRWRTADGQLLEVQFHTPQSFEAKQLTHRAYERQRNPLTSGQERVKLKAFQQEVSAGIPVPRGVGDIANYRKEGY
ncbi:MULTISPECIES: hypothetical protein [unclassified Spirillospora]|uniref:hypothetical protein n=1 Tax=unclassified Spirillospora TaxID=2642701 RepID=UPI0037117474